jgi:hypothetical protein
MMNYDSENSCKISKPDEKLLDKEKRKKRRSKIYKQVRTLYSYFA